MTRMARDELTRRYDGPTIWIGGAWRRAGGPGAFEVIDPATEARLAELPVASAGDVRDAIAAAHAAFPGWRRTTATERAAALTAIADALAARKAALATAVALEIGKPLAQAEAEVENCRASLSWYAAEAMRLQGVVIPPRAPGARTEISHEPVGVAALMTPWNFPVGLVARKLAPALAAGCTTVVKPAEEAALSAVLFMEAVAEAGLPAGVVNLVLGQPAEISEVVMAAPEVRKVSFTGSVPVGRQLFAQAAPTLKHLSLELGGNAPVVVFDDVDAAEIGRQAAQRKASNAGQVCVSPNRFFVHRAGVERFAEAFVETARSLKIGGPFDEGVQMGPLATERRRDAIEAMVAAALDHGARIETGGRRPPDRNAGWFYEPTLVREVSDEMALMREEIFGPVAPLAAFEDEAEVLERANATDLGLAAFAFTADEGRAARMREGLEAGMVGLNTFVLGRVEAPFGGIKQSGFGREGGSWGMMGYLETKWAESAPAPGTGA